MFGLYIRAILGKGGGRIKKRVKKNVSFILLLTIAFVLCGYPLVFLVGGACRGNDELIKFFTPILAEYEQKVRWNILPQFPTMRNIIRTLLDTPEFWVLFWNSMKIMCSVVLGQICISIPAAWGFANYKLKGNKTLFHIYIFLMLLPFQAKMLSEYLILNRLHLLDTHWAIILPGIFSTYPVFVMYQFFTKIPQEVIESARLDGADEWNLFIKIGIPIAKNGIVAVLMLCAIEYWNIIEQPLLFLKSKALWPLSLYMPVISETSAGDSFAKVTIITIPLFITFLAGQEYLQSGINIMLNNERR